MKGEFKYMDLAKSVRMTEKQRSPAKKGGDKKVTIGLEELHGRNFAYGVQGQVEKYITTTQALETYVRVNFSRDMYTLINEKVEATHPEPRTPGKDATPGEMKRYEILLKDSISKQDKYKAEKAKVFGIIMGQCTMAMKNKLESLPEYKTLNDDDNVVGLLNTIKGLVYTTDKGQYKYWTMQAQMRNLLTLRQESKEPLGKFCTRFLAQAEATEDVWGEMSPANVTGAKQKKEARNKYLACVFIAAVD